MYICLIEIKNNNKKNIRTKALTLVKLSRLAILKRIGTTTTL